MSVFETIDILINDCFKRYLSVGDAEPIALQEIMKYNMKLFKGKRELYTSRENKKEFVKRIEDLVIGKCDELKKEAIRRHSQGASIISYIGNKWKEWQHVFEKMHDAMIHIADVYTSAIEPGVVYGPCTTRTLFVKKLSRIFINHVFLALKEDIVSEIISMLKSENREGAVETISTIVDITICCGELMMVNVTDDKLKFYVDIIEKPYLIQVREACSKEIPKFLMEPEFPLVAEKLVQFLNNEHQIAKRFLAPRTATELKQKEIRDSVNSDIKKAVKKYFPVLLNEYKEQYEKTIKGLAGKGKTQVEKNARNICALVDFSLDDEFNKELASLLEAFFASDVYAEVESSFKNLSVKPTAATVSSSAGPVSASSASAPAASQGQAPKRILRRTARRKPGEASATPAQPAEAPAPVSQPVSSSTEKGADKPAASAPQDSTKGLAARLTDAIFAVYYKYKYLVDTLFNGNAEFKKAMRDSFRLLFQKERLPKMAFGPKSPGMKENAYSHQLEIIIPVGIAGLAMKSFNRRDGVNKQELVNDLLSAYDFLPAKDIFVKKYKSLLEYYVITNFPRCFVDYHKMFVDELGKKSADVQDIKAFFTEIDESIPLNEKFCCAFQEYRNFSTLVLGSGHSSLVDIDKEYDNFKMKDELALYVEKFKKKLDEKGSTGKRYELVKTSSIVEVEMKHEHGVKTTIVCNAVQAHILMLLNKGQQTVETLVESTGLSMAHIKPILKTFQEKGIILPLQDVVLKTPVCVNHARAQSRATTIDIARTMMAVHEDVNDEEVVAKRVAVLKANIVRIMKANKQLPYHELYHKVTDATQKWFAATTPLMKKAIAELTNNEFIKVVLLDRESIELWKKRCPEKNVKEVYEYIS